MPMFFLILFSGEKEIPSCPESKKPPLILGATLHTGTNTGIIESGALSWKEEKFTMIADARIIRINLSKYQVFQWNKHHIYPLHTMAKPDSDVLKDWGISPRQWAAAIKNKNGLKHNAPATFVVTSKKKPFSLENVQKIFIKGKRFEKKTQKDLKSD